MKRGQKAGPRTGRRDAIRILIADGQEVARIGIRAMLTGEPDFLVVGEAATLDDTLAQAACLQPDLVLVEARLSSGSGVEACRALITADPTIRVIILTQSGDSALLAAAVAAGAHGHLLKSVDRAELLQAIRTVFWGEGFPTPGLTEAVVRLLRRDDYALENSRYVTRLSPREQRILPMIADGMTNKEIAASLGLSDKTVKNYLASVYSKLGVTGRAHAAAVYAQREAQDALGAGSTGGVSDTVADKTCTP